MNKWPQPLLLLTLKQYGLCVLSTFFKIHINKNSEHDFIVLIVPLKLMSASEGPTDPVEYPNRSQKLLSMEASAS